MTTISEFHQKYQTAVTSKKESDEAQVRLDQALADAEDQKGAVLKKIANGQKVYSQAVMTGAGAVQEAAANEALQAARRDLENIEDRIAALTSTGEKSFQMEEAIQRDLQQAINVAHGRMWREVRDVEVAKMPSSARGVFVRAYVAALRSDWHPGTFESFVGAQIAAPTDSEIEGILGDLKKAHGLNL